MDFDFVVAGAGFAGSVCAERLANGFGKRVLVVEKRDHIGGNAWDYSDPHGVLVHGYGPHIFHTKSDEVWSYLSRFTAWRPYEHRVLGCVDGKLVPLPFNLTSLHALFPGKEAGDIQTKLVAKYGMGARVPILELRKQEDAQLRELAEFVYAKVFVNYTRKQWGLPIERLSPSVSARVPVVVGWDDRYFDDAHQAMPAMGYTPLFEKMLQSPHITLQLNTDYRDIAAELSPKAVIFTGMVDSFFAYRYGTLAYRSLDFTLQNLPVESFQTAATVNYPNEHDYTRITEFKKLTGQTAPSTTIAYEYPRPYEKETDEAYYPIPLEENTRLHSRYVEDARLLHNVLFVGRLAQYRYLNMDQVVLEALRAVEAVMKDNA